MKTLYKRLISISMVIFCSVLLFTSCEDFLAEKPYDFYDEQDFYKDVSELELAVNGAYEVLSQKMTWTSGLLICTKLSKIRA